ncbi:hypothetical protein [Nocardioides insulae]|uniref:hypothetical protein n=1 Tax=Nocardioides insulae TaxID=394734 RepID=UPI0004178DAC|nr:hypothetical protein [Nocardioides insulae]
MARRVVVHVGLPKTGTTYIQSVLWQNRDRLAEQGILFPGRSRRQHMRASMVVREHPGVDSRAKDAARAWDDLVSEIAAWPGTALVSHEFFGAATAEQAARALGRLRRPAPADPEQGAEPASAAGPAGADEAGSAYGDPPGEEAEIDLVVTARDLLTITTSYWQEFVKHGFAGQPLAEFPRPGGPAFDEWGPAVLDLESVLRAWSGGLPPERVHVLVVPGQDAPRTSLLDSFAAILGFDTRGVDTQRAKENTSLGLIEAELIRRVAPRLDGFRAPLDRGVWIRGYLAHDQLVPRAGERFLPPPERIEELRRRSVEAVGYVRDSGFTVHGDLDRLLVPDVLPATRQGEDVTDAELLDAATDTIVGLMEDVRRYRKETKQLRRQLAAPPPPPPSPPPSRWHRLRARLGRRTVEEGEGR